MKIKDLTYQVTWDSYQNQMKSMLQDIMTSTEYSDVTLVSDDLQHIRAHKVVLSSVSPVLKSILKNFNDRNPAIYMKGIKYEDLEPILEYIYVGETTLRQEKINEFINLARNLELKDIGDISYNVKTDDPPVIKMDTVEELFGKKSSKNENHSIVEETYGTEKHVKMA